MSVCGVQAQARIASLKVQINRGATARKGKKGEGGKVQVPIGGQDFPAKKTSPSIRGCGDEAATNLFGKLNQGKKRLISGVQQRKNGKSATQGTNQAEN